MISVPFPHPVEEDIPVSFLFSEIRHFWVGEDVYDQQILFIPRYTTGALLASASPQRLYNCDHQATISEMTKTISLLNSLPWSETIAFQRQWYCHHLYVGPQHHH